MVGDWIEKFPETVEKIHEAGHEIAAIVTRIHI